MMRYVVLLFLLSAAVNGQIVVQQGGNVALEIGAGSIEKSSKIFDSEKSGQVLEWFSIVANGKGQSLAASLVTPPGVYRVKIGDQDRSTYTVEVSALPRSTSALPPVLLVRGFDPVCIAQGNSSETFGDLAKMLTEQGRDVWWLDQCQFQETRSIDGIGEILRRWVSERPEERFDLIGHSMGGLIIRSAISGRIESSSTSSWVPLHASPIGDRIRKVIFLGTPHLGAPLANSPIAGHQQKQIRDFSAFLLQLASWNLGKEDFDGADVLNIAGSGVLRVMATALFRSFLLQVPSSSAGFKRVF